MPRDLAWQATDDLVRAQLAMFQALGDEIGLTADDRQQALDLDDGTWRAWTSFLSRGPRPREPAVPRMLQRLGEAAFALASAAQFAPSDGGPGRRHASCEAAR